MKKLFGITLGCLFLTIMLLIASCGRVFVESNELIVTKIEISSKEHDFLYCVTIFPDKVKHVFLDSIHLYTNDDTFKVGDKVKIVKIEDNIE